MRQPPACTPSSPLFCLKGGDTSSRRRVSSSQGADLRQLPVHVHETDAAHRRAVHCFGNGDVQSYSSAANELAFAAVLVPSRGTASSTLQEAPVIPTWGERKSGRDDRSDLIPRCKSQEYRPVRDHAAREADAGSQSSPATARVVALPVRQLLTKYYQSGQEATRFSTSHGLMKW